MSRYWWVTAAPEARINQVQHAAEAGLTKRETAILLGTTFNVIYNFAQLHKIRFNPVVWRRRRDKAPARQTAQAFEDIGSPKPRQLFVSQTRGIDNLVHLQDRRHAPIPATYFDSY